MLMNRFESVGKPGDYMAPIRQNRPKKTRDVRCTCCGMIKTTAHMAEVNHLMGGEIGVCKECRAESMRQMDN